MGLRRERWARRGVGLACVGALALTLAACGGGDDDASTTSTTSGATGTGGGSETSAGAVAASGATFPAPAYQEWGQTSGLVSYSGTGSGAGIQSLISGVVAFAGSDAPLTDEEKAQLASSRGGVTPVYFPTLLGAVTVPTNVQGVTKPLRLTGAALGGIFSGGISRWNDPAIASTNSGVSLPDAPIVACVRADSSGTSFNFSTYLTKVSPAFKTKVSASKTPSWTAANVQKAPGNPGVAQCVKTNQNSIGYVDLGDAERAGLDDQLAAIRGRSGQFVQPTTASISAAGKLTPAQVPKDLTPDLTNSPAPGAYPISITTWIVAYSDYQKAGAASRLPATKQFLEYVYSTKAQNQLPGLGYAPLPPALANPATAQIATLK